MNSTPFSLLECQDEALRTHLLKAQRSISVKYSADKRGTYRTVSYNGEPYWIDTSKGERLLFSGIDTEYGWRTIHLRECDRKEWNIIVKYSHPIGYGRSSPRLVLLIKKGVPRQWNDNEVEHCMYIG
jgi:hypothetical protein